MFNPWRRFFSVAAAATLPILAALWTAILNTPTTPRYTRFLYVGAICLISVGAAYVTQIKPAANLEKPILTFLSLLAGGPLALGNSLGIGPRINLMVVRTPWYLFGPKRLSVVWGEGMNGHPDVRFRCSSYQGVAGMAYRTRKRANMDLETINPAIFNFTPAQLAETAHVKAVWSWPVYEVDKAGVSTGKLSGIVNLDALSPGAQAHLIANSAAFDLFLTQFALVASTIV